ncbi:hypothetical protein L2E82_26725 [Cichorium intybus]|uniref:Uncharacterized protein n=1 Tax=Cichorium intybus TaxID=13427 RepID=A0ACB9CR49_CICIN|nr:hypothetical protein L2E82_26725 [Cichorium intybus]
MVIISYLPFPFTCPGKNKVPFFLVKDFHWDPHHQRTTIHCSRHKFPYNKSLATYKCLCSEGTTTVATLSTSLSQQPFLLVLDSV